jgi:exodeoxyribonuclease VII large subunit
MWCFNDERVARAILACRVPLISAVGHEIDFTIADFVADLRAPTPSAAAELVSRNAAEICETIALQQKRIVRVWLHREQVLKQKVFQLSKRLVDPKRRLQDLTLRCDELTQRLESAAKRYFERKLQAVKLLLSRLPSPREVILRLGQEVSMLCTQIEAHVVRTHELQRAQMGRLTAMLDSLSPLKVVERGYSITRKEGQLIKSAAQLKKGDTVELQFAKGKAEACILTLS